MGFVGNKKGPKKSDIILRLGPAYFGISDEQFAQDVELCMEDESRNEVDPVHVDRLGRRFLRFLAPGRSEQRFYLEENGYHLIGKIEEIRAEGDE